MNHNCVTAADECPQFGFNIPGGTRSAWRRSRALLAGMSSVLLAVISAAAAAAQGAAPPQAEAPEQVAPYLTPQRLVRIAEGRTINLVCLGQGAPTVVLTAGLGNWSQAWYRIQGSLSRRTRVCSWDPAGSGFSSPSPEPQDAVHETEDLEEALKGASLDGPYVMVAHSAGAYIALRFDDQHPTAVVGTVLVDPSIPDQDAVRKQVAPKFAAFGNGGPMADAARRRKCAAEFQSAALKPGMPEFDRCTGSLPLPEAFSSLTVRLAQLDTDPARLLTQASALENAFKNGIEAINPQRRYGDMPLIVLSSGSHPLPPNLPSDVSQQMPLYFQALLSGHDAYAALSTRGRRQLVPDSGHFIQLENPAVVLAAIDSVLADSRTQLPH
jgi:pimeloyl-ACP methyl ester carboxylesterase